VVKALTGAAVGAGTKLIIDKITGKPSVVPKNPSGGTSKIPKIPTSVVKDQDALVKAANAAKAEKARADNDALANSFKDQGEKVGLPSNTIPNTANPNGGSTIDESMFGDEVTGDGFNKSEGREFATHENGDIYEVMPDGAEVLYRAAEVAEDEYMTDSLGNVYKTMPDGTYELYREAEVGEDITAGENVGYEDAAVDNTFVDDVVYDDSTDYINYPVDEYDYNYYVNPPDYIESDLSYLDEYKRGGLTTMMKKGGVPHFVYGGDAVVGATTKSGYTGDSGGYEYYGDPTDYTDASVYPMTTSSYVDDPSDFTDASVYANTQTPVAMSASSDYVTELENPAQQGDEAYGYRYFSDGTVIAPNGDYYKDDELVWSKSANSPGGGERPWYENLGSKLSTGFQDLTGISDDTLKKLTGVLPSAGAGALVASLLGGDYGGGGSGNQNQGLDMSQVGLINPRTTDFGIGPTKFVGYDEYGTSADDYTPNEELLRNLNAPGFNPVNEGDYGYEDAPAEAPKMASGGLSSMATPVASYYTFGQPADILANLGMRPQPPMNPPEMMPQVGQQQPPQQAPQQGQQQGMPQQMAQQTPQGMPQQGMMPQGMPPPMRKGGLPHISNVPMTEGRMDFRQGSAVHGEGDGQSDDIPAMLADGEYVIDAETVAQIGNGSTKAGAQALDKFREGIRAHKRSAPVNKIPPKTKALTSYLKGAR
jgi:hypothetical protein